MSLCWYFPFKFSAMGLQLPFRREKFDTSIKKILKEEKFVTSYNFSELQTSIKNGEMKGCLGGSID